MSAQFNQSDAHQYFSTAWTHLPHASARQTPARKADDTRKSSRSAAEFGARGAESAPRAESQHAADWAGDCLFDCYND